MKQISLSAQDIDYIGRVVDTEVSPAIRERDPVAYSQMVGAVVDTVANRLATGKYPSVSAVINAPRQFSGITGPAKLNPTGSIQKTPAATAMTRAVVEQHLAERAAGKPSLVGGALNYANPAFSDKKNIKGWIGPMEAAGSVKLGVGQNTHIHGLAPGKRAAPEYGISLPDSVTAKASLAGPMQRYEASYPTNLAYQRSLPDVGPVPQPSPKMFAAVPSPRPSTMMAFGPSPRSMPNNAAAAIEAALSRPSAPAPAAVQSNLLGTTGSPRSVTPSQPAFSMPSRPVSPTPTNLPSGVMSRMAGFAPAVDPTMAAAVAARPTTQPASFSMPSRPVTPTPQSASVQQRMAGFAPEVSPAMMAAVAARPTTPAVTTASPSMFSQPTPPRSITPASAYSRPQTLTSAQEANLASRLGPAPSLSPAKAANVTERLDAAGPFNSTLSSIGRAISPNQAAAATMTPDRPAVAAAPARSAPVSTGFAGPVGSPRSMEATIAGPLAANRFSPAPSTPAPAAPTRTALQATAMPSSAPTAAARPNFAGAVGSPRAMEAALNAPSKPYAQAPDSYQQPAFSTAAPKIDALGQPPIAGLQPATSFRAPTYQAPQALAPLSAPVTVSSPPSVASVPQNVPSAPATFSAPSVPAQAAIRSTQTGGFPGLPSIPDAPSKPSMFSSIGSYVGDNKARLAGGLIGTAAFGPIGGILGSMIGSAIQGSGAQPSQAALNAAQTMGFDGFGYGAVTGGTGSTGLGQPNVPDAPTGRANYDTGRSGSEGASKAAKDNAGKGRGLY